MTLTEIKALVPETGTVSFNVRFRGTSDVLTISVPEGLSGSITLEKGPRVSKFNVSRILVPYRFSSTSGRELLDLIADIELSDVWDDDPLAL